MSVPVFSLCHATKRLPMGWESAAASWYKHCDKPRDVEFILCMDVPISAEASGVWVITSVKKPDKFFAHRKLRANLGRPCAVDAWNTAAACSEGQFLITVSDDFFPPEHWDTEILKVIPDLQGEYVLAADFGGNYPLLTFSFLTRKRYERYGYIFYPEYLGMRADDDFDAVARLDGVVIEAPHLKFDHRHPYYANTEVAWDETYAWQHRREAYEIGDRVLARRKAEGFQK